MKEGDQQRVDLRKLPEVVVKGVSRLAVQVVQNYTDGPSRVRLREVILTLARKHGSAIPALASSLLSQAQNHANVPHST
ncbi:hypothetical protein E2C01_072379 [Portunus trituberculatus]|uniref:Uncharacterized protein n=1 Tax=Portunus trituberculatus TaxID=210409 RepID=A0A5B7HZQ2_PORTR|nr:hypothetical protein [Portunus trituberculatus]